MRARLVAGLAGVLASGLAVIPQPAFAEDTFNCVDFQPDVQGLPTGEAESESTPLVAMQVAQAQRLVEQRTGREPGEGWAIAVLDSGVVPTGLEVATVVDGGAPPEDYHGTVVANLAAGDPRSRSDGGGLVGVAPAARIIDIPVTEVADTPGAETQVDNDRLVAGLEWVAAEARRADIGVAVVAHWMDENAELRRAVQAVLARDVVVVASTGNRPDQDDPHYPAVVGLPENGEDAAGLVYPAGYRGVLGVGASAEGSGLSDVREAVLQSSAIDVVAPTAGAVSRGLTGQTCALNSDGDVATSWAAAEVAGLVALLRTRFPQENRHQIVARLLHTASGTADRPNVVSGAGVVQPVEAVTRPLSPARDGTIVEPDPPRDVPRATAPEPREDLLAQPRRQAVWIGLVGGGVLVLALVLRPLLTRRRGATSAS